MNKIRRMMLPVRVGMAVYSSLFAIMCIISRHVVDEPSDRSTILTTYVTPFKLIDILLFIVFTILAYFVICLIQSVLPKLLCKMITGKPMKIPTWIMVLIVFILIMVAWSPYIMSYWPGGIYNDTLDSIHIALGKAKWSNQNTVLYALWWRLIFSIGQIVNQGEYGGLKLMTLVQPAIMAGVGAFFFTWQRRRGIKTLVVALGVASYALFPVFPYYAVSMWKDTLFSVNMFLFSWTVYLIIDGLMTSKAVSSHNIIRYVIVSLSVIFGRNNGLIIYVISAIVLVLVIRKYADKKSVSIVAAISAIVLVVSIIIQGPVYNLCGVEKSESVEKYGIPLQQVGYIVSMGGNIDDTSEEVLSEILPMDGWINLYSPTVVDTIKFDPLFCRDYFNMKTSAFVKAYISVIAKNPVLAIKGYLLTTIGFWDAWKSSSSAYICTSHCWNAEYFMSDYFNMYTGMYLSDIVGPRWYISSGLLIWLMLLAFTLVSRGKNWKYFVAIIPTMALWLTLMLATPLAFSFRYVFSLLLCMPVYFMAIIRGTCDGQDSYTF